MSSDILNLLRFTTAGSVDDGKSTLIGRLLHDADGVYEDQLESVRKADGNGLDLALITDGLRAEREQGITIDVAYRYFSTPRRRFIIADTPGHEQYTRNMATGASTADLAVILLDARKGILRQTRRHVYLSWLLGIRRLAVAVNKMDLVGYSQDVFDQLRLEFTQFCQRFSGLDLAFVPISALKGDNVVLPGHAMPWYDGPALLQYLETVPVENLSSCTQPFRFPVQYVIRSDSGFRVYAGQIVSGSVRPGDAVVILPSGHRSRIRAISTYNGELPEAITPMSVSLSLDDQFDVGRGDMLADVNNHPATSHHVRANLVWMAETPLALDRPYLVKHTNQRVCAQVSRVTCRHDIDKLTPVEASRLCLNDIGDVEIDLHRPLYCDPYKSNRKTGSFVLIDPVTNQTLAAGMILSATKEKSRTIRIRGSLDKNTGTIVWFTGLSSSGKTTLSHVLQERLWAMGLQVECLDGDEVRRHLSKGLGFSREDRDENVRRIGYVAQLLARNGVIVLVSAISPYRDIRDEVRKNSSDFIEVYVNATLEACEQRDVKGLYKKARAGEIASFTGIDDPYEPPLEPEIECQTDRETIAQSAAKVLNYLKTRLADLAP